MAVFSPLSRSKVVHRRSRPLQMQTEAGVVKLKVSYGQDAIDKHWGCPIREQWGLTSHQQPSPAFAMKLKTLMAVWKFLFGSEDDEEEIEADLEAEKEEDRDGKDE